MSVEKCFLPKSRSTQLDSYSRENQDAMLHIWKGVVEADKDRSEMMRWCWLLIFERHACDENQTPSC